MEQLLVQVFTNAMEMDVAVGVVSVGPDVPKDGAIQQNPGIKILVMSGVHITVNVKNIGFVPILVPNELIHSL